MIAECSRTLACQTWAGQGPTGTQHSSRSPASRQAPISVLDAAERGRKAPLPAGPGSPGEVWGLGHTPTLKQVRHLSPDVQWSPSLHGQAGRAGRAVRGVARAEAAGGCPPQSRAAWTAVRLGRPPLGRGRLRPWALTTVPGEDGEEEVLPATLPRAPKAPLWSPHLQGRPGLEGQSHRPCQPPVSTTNS